MYLFVIRAGNRTFCFGHINFEMPFRDAWPNRDAKQRGIGSTSLKEST